MTTLESLQRQITTAQDLQSVVKTMKVLAAVSIRQYERAVESLAEYTHTIELGLQAILQEAEVSHLPAPSIVSQRTAAIVFGSDQGMCGQFNEQIATATTTQLQLISPFSTDLVLITVGARVIAPLAATGFTILTSLPMPSSLAGITPSVQELLLQIEAWQFSQSARPRESQPPVDRIILFYNQPQSNTGYTSVMKQLLPLDQTWLQSLQWQPWQSRTHPIWTMETRQLFASLVRQYLFVTIYRAFAESLASENASRLVSMQVAEQNIETRLTEFNTEFQQQRQTSITDEILEIVSGAEVGS